MVPMVRFLLLFLPFLLWAQGVKYEWYLSTKGYALKLILPPTICKKFKPPAVFLYLLSDGRVYRRTIKERPKRCEVWKVIKNPKPMKVLIFFPKLLKVRDLGRIEKSGF